MTRYRTIVADPPWHYGSPLPPFTGSTKPSAVPYGTLSVDEISALPVRDWADADAHLYLWTTNTHLRHAWSVAEAWGFRYSKNRGGDMSTDSPIANEISTPIDLYIAQIRSFNPELAERVQVAVSGASRLSEFTEAELHAMYVSMKRPAAGLLANSLAEEVAAEVRLRHA